MADTKISALSAVTDVLATDEFVLARSGTTKKIDAIDLQAGLVSPTDWVIVTKASDESVASSTTLQNDDELFFTTASGGVYEIRAVIIYGSPAGGTTPDLKTSWGEDSTARGSLMCIVFAASSGVAVGSVLADQADFNQIGTATGDRSALFSGSIVGNGGTFRLKWAQNTSGANATIVRAGSELGYRRVL